MAALLTRLKNFTLGNKQQLMNILGVYFVLTVAIHDYRIRKAWKELENERDTYKDELHSLKKQLTDEKFLSDMEINILKKRTKNILKEEMSKLVQAENEDFTTTEGKKSVGIAVTDKNNEGGARMI